MSISSIYQTLRFGKQTVLGTGVPAIFLARSTRAMPAQEQPFEAVDASGQRADVDVILGKQSSRWALSGRLNFTDLAFWFAFALGKVGIAANVMTISLDQDVARPYFGTFEFGTSATPGKAVDGFISDLSINFSPNAVPTWSATLRAGRFDEAGVVLSPSPTALAKQHCGPKTISLWVATTAAGLTTGANQLDCAKLLVDMNFNISNLGDQLFAICEGDSPSSKTDTKPTITNTVTLAKTSPLYATWMTAKDNGTTLYARILCNGPTVGAVQSILDIRFPFKFHSPSTAENQNAYCGSLVMNAIHDGDEVSPLGTALQVQFTAGWIGTVFGVGGPASTGWPTP